MLFKILIWARFIIASPEAQIIDQVPDNWYESTTNLFNYCVKVNFGHPICPQINRNSFSDFNFSEEFFKPPVGELSARTLFQAMVLDQEKRPPIFWFVGLKLEGSRPRKVPARLWAEAQWLWARILYDQGKLKESLQLYDKILEEFKGKALFHQQRAWVQFFSGQFEKSLGSIVSSESPLIYPVPFFEKYFLRALAEKERCHYASALKTITSGRAALKFSEPDPSNHPWVTLCDEQGLGTTCSRLRAWYSRIYQQKTKSALADLDILEIELKDKVLESENSAKDKSSAIVWPFIGENWSDELGYYSVPLPDKCS
ncbi:MAG: tetratricopeptide repeat protein [Bdellovibrionota bacterium]